MKKKHVTMTTKIDDLRKKHYKSIKKILCLFHTIICFPLIAYVSAIH